MAPSLTFNAPTVASATNTAVFRALFPVSYDFELCLDSTDSDGNPVATNVGALVVRELDQLDTSFKVMEDQQLTVRSSFS